MRITRVSPDGDFDRFGGRALVVQTDRGSFRTPHRALTSSEFQYKAKLPFEPPLNNDISEVVSQFYGDKWNKFMNTNGSFDSRLRTIEFFSDKMTYTLKRYFPQLPSAIELNDSAIKQLLELQRMSDLDFITIPNLPAGINDFEKTVSGFAEEVLSERREPLIYLDMGLDYSVFKNRFLTLLELSNTDQIHSIGLIYRPIRKFILNYRLLWENRESRVFLQMSYVPREFTRTTAASTMHLLQKWGIDSFSVRVGNYVLPRNGDREPMPKHEAIRQTKRFDPEPLVFRRFHTWGDHGDVLNCACPVCRDMSVEDFLSTYDSTSEDYPGQVFNAANRLHEYYRSSEEFTNAREYIRTGDLSEYFKTKEGLRKSDVPVPPTTKTLNGWM